MQPIDAYLDGQPVQVGWEQPAPPPAPAQAVSVDEPLSAWVVRVKDRDNIIFGPFYDRVQAEKFAGFLSHAVDPAEVLPLFDPMNEAMAYFAELQKERAT